MSLPNHPNVIAYIVRTRRVKRSPNQVLTHAARAAATQLNFQPLCGRARAKGSGESKPRARRTLVRVR